MWNDYETFASAGGPFRWLWTLVIGVFVTLLIVTWVGQFARFFGRSVAKGFRETNPGSIRRRERADLNARLAADVHRVIDGAQLDGDQQG